MDKGTHVGVVHPEDGIKGRVVDNPHVSVPSRQTVDLIVDRLDAVVGGRGLPGLGAVVGEREPVAHLGEQVVRAVPQREGVVLQHRLHEVGLRLGARVRRRRVADRLLPRLPLRDGSGQMRQTPEAGTSAPSSRRPRRSRPWSRRQSPSRRG